MHNIRLLRRRFDLEFASQLELILPQRRFVVSDAKFPALIKNHGPRAATSVKIYLVHQPTGQSIRIDPQTELSVSPGNTVEVNLFFELDAALQKLETYDSRSRKVLNRTPINFAIQYDWAVSGLGSTKRGSKDVTFIWQGGQFGGGLEWDVV